MAAKRENARSTTGTRKSPKKKAAKKKATKKKARAGSDISKAVPAKQTAASRPVKGRPANRLTSDPATEILAALDENARGSMWVTFENHMGAFEYHAMRMIAVRERTGPGWAVLLETVAGDYFDERPEEVEAAGIRGTVCGGNFGEPPDRRPQPSRTRRPLGMTIEGRRQQHSAHLDGLVVHGPKGVLNSSDAMLQDLDLRPGRLCGPLPGGAEDSNFVLALRAYLTAFPGAFWGDPLASVAAFGFTGAVDIIVVVDAFEHVVGLQRPQNPELRPHAILPSQSRTFRSLAQCIVARDASLFEAGESNLEWRRWAVFDDEGLAPRRTSAKAKRR